MKLRVYLDTTVISAAEDRRAPDRREQTIAFFDRASEFELATSELTGRELNATPDLNRRATLTQRLATISMITISDEMRLIASEYIARDIIPAAYEDDAIHIAAAVLTSQDVLLSWNFRHMVNRRRRSLVNLLNASRNLPLIEILAPPEILV